MNWEEHLEPGETLIWSGKPRGGYYTGCLVQGWHATVPWLILIGGPIFYVGGSLANGQSVWEGLVFMPFIVLFGLWALYLVKTERRDRQRQHYAITSHSALMWHENLGGRLYQTPILPRLKGLLSNNTVSIGAETPIVHGPFMGGFGMRRVLGQGPRTPTRRGIVLYDLGKPMDAVYAIRDAVEALPN